MDYEKQTISVYAKQREKYGAGNVQSLAFGSVPSQTRRFGAFASIYDFAGKTVVDVGCGHGDFYLWLVDQGMKPAGYCGVDIVPEHIEIARERLPGECELLAGDFLKAEVGKCDIAVCSGALSHNFDDWLDVCSKVLNKMWDISEIGMAFNMESPYGFPPERLKELERFRTLDPAYWLDFAFSITRKVVFLHDYLPADYTIGMRHGDYS